MGELEVLAAALSGRPPDGDVFQHQMEVTMFILPGQSGSRKTLLFSILGRKSVSANFLGCYEASQSVNAIKAVSMIYPSSVDNLVVTPTNFYDCHFTDVDSFSELKNELEACQLARLNSLDWGEVFKLVDADWSFCDKGRVLSVKFFLFRQMSIIEDRVRELQSTYGKMELKIVKDPENSVICLVGVMERCVCFLQSFISFKQLGETLTYNNEDLLFFAFEGFKVIPSFSGKIEFLDNGIERGSTSDSQISKELLQKRPDFVPTVAEEFFNLKLSRGVKDIEGLAKAKAQNCYKVKANFQELAASADKLSKEAAMAGDFSLDGFEAQEEGLNAEVFKSLLCLRFIYGIKKRDCFVAFVDSNSGEVYLTGVESEIRDFVELNSEFLNAELQQVNSLSEPFRIRVENTIKKRLVKESRTVSISETGEEKKAEGRALSGASTFNGTILKDGSVCLVSDNFFFDMLGKTAILFDSFAVLAFDDEKGKSAASKFGVSSKVLSFTAVQTFTNHVFSFPENSFLGDSLFYEPFMGGKITYPGMDSGQKIESIVQYTSRSLKSRSEKVVFFNRLAPIYRDKTGKRFRIIRSCFPQPSIGYLFAEPEDGAWQSSYYLGPWPEDHALDDKVIEEVLNEISDKG